MTIEDGTHSGSWNVVGKLTLHTVQKPQNRESIFITRWKSKIKIYFYLSTIDFFQAISQFTIH